MLQQLYRVILVGLMAVFLAVALAPPASLAHPTEDDLIRQLEEQYGRPRPEQDPDRQSQQTAEERAAEEAAAAPPSLGQTITQYLILGYKHILPKGTDHILFVCGIFLASTRFRPLLIQVTAFTVAHTCSLALAMLGYVDVPASIVEPLIAFSIAGVAIENIMMKRMAPWRPVVVFGFGLLHGLGFAGVLLGIGMPQGQFVPGLISFNVGVEIGQLTVLLSAWAILHWFYNHSWYRLRVQVPLSALIAVVGLYWTVERIFF
jgi:hypothetical protein